MAGDLEITLINPVGMAFQRHNFSHEIYFSDVDKISQVFFPPEMIFG